MLNKLNFEVGQFVAKESSRWSIENLRIAPNDTRAINGHLAVTVTGTTMRPEGFPVIDGEMVQAEFEPFLIAADEAKKVVKAIPAARQLPALNHAGICANGTEHAKIATTDLDSTTILRPLKVQGNFPAFEQYEPKDESVLTITLDPNYLAKLAAFAAKFDKSAVKLTFYGPAKQVKFECSNHDGQAMTAWLMPTR